MPKIHIGPGNHAWALCGRSRYSITPLCITHHNRFQQGWVSLTRLRWRKSSEEEGKCMAASSFFANKSSRSYRSHIRVREWDQSMQRSRGSSGGCEFHLAILPMTENDQQLNGVCTQSRWRRSASSLVLNFLTFFLSGLADGSQSSGLEIKYPRHPRSKMWFPEPVAL